jgi:putative restriction endonuclease
MDRDELLNRLGSLRRATAGGRRLPHKPLLLLWLFGRFAATGSTAVTYDEVHEPLTRLLDDFGPSVGIATARRRAAMPFVHLERELWELHDAGGYELGPDLPEQPRGLRALGAHGRLRSGVEMLLADPATLTQASRLLVEQHFTTALADPLCAAVGLDLTTLDEAAVRPVARRARRPGFAEEVLRTYGYSCAACGFDGALGRNPVGIEAAHVRWHSQGGPDELSNAVALCALHHVLLDRGVLGLTSKLTIEVSRLYVARRDGGRQLYELAGHALAEPLPGQPPVAPEHIAWHRQEVFKAAA